MPSTFVPPSGKLDAAFVLVGEQPGKQEVLRHQPFVGPAGENLNECLHAADILRSNCYLTNVVKDLDHPLKYYFPTLVGGRKEKVEISAAGYEYINQLKAELSKTSANVIIPCGNVALYALTNRVGITNWRGSILESTLLPGRKVIPTFHPATYTQEKLYLEPENYLNKYLIILDLKKAAREAYYPELFLTPRQLITAPGYYDVLTFLEKCRLEAYKGATLWFDIELTPKTQELSCISFAPGDGECMCIPFVDYKGDYWDAEQEMVIMKAISYLLSDPQIKKGGQNVIFDSHFLLKKYGIRSVNLDDTMIAQKILYPEFRVGLNFITAMWTDIPYYKNDGKIWLEGTGEYKRGWEYNCLDSLSCASAFPTQFNELHERGNHHAYFSKRKIIEPCTYMMQHGIRVDLAGMKLARDTNASQLEQLAEKFKSVCGEDININSPKQLMEYFYVKRGVPTYSEEGKLTINIRALHNIKRSGHCIEEMDILLQYRKLHKQAGTYLNLENVDEDGRIRCSYNVVGTKYGRMSSSKNIFGTGLNLQNVSPEMSEFLIADDGYVIYSLDMSQYENRIVAYVGQIPEMIRVFEEGLDSHRMTGSLVFGIPYDEVSDKPGSSKIGNGDASLRDWAKRANHCHFEDTQVLTHEGWISIKLAREYNCPIYTCDLDKGHGNFLVPESWFYNTYTGRTYEFSGRYVSQHVTPEHRIPEIARYSGLLKWTTADKTNMRANSVWPTSSLYLGGQANDNDNAVRLLVAYQADGTTLSNGDLRWHFKKREKVARLCAYLKIEDTMFNISQDSYGVYVTVKKSEPIVNYIREHFPAKADKRWKIDKLLWWQFRSLKVLADEIALWDGNGKDYWTSILDNAETIQTIFHLTGYKSFVGKANSNNTWRVSQLLPNARFPAIDKLYRSVKNAEIFCPQTSTGAFLVRRNGVISVSLNSFNYGMGWRRMSQLYEIPGTEAKWLHSAYHKAYPRVEHGYWKHVQDSIRSTRSTKNLLGRQILFLMPWGDKMLHNAYSSIPQSTCADVIDSRGISFTYYNEAPHFRTVELLTQVHDSIAFEMPLNIPVEEHAKVLLDIKRSLETPLKWNGHSINTPVDLIVSKNLNKFSSSSKKIKLEGLDVPALSHQLTEVHMKLN